MSLVRPLPHVFSFPPRPAPSERTVCIGDLQPLEVEHPVLVEDDEEEPIPIPSSSKGKRKAPE